MLHNNISLFLLLVQTSQRFLGKQCPITLLMCATERQQLTIAYHIGGWGANVNGGKRNNRGIRRPTAAAAKDLGRVEDRHSIDVVVGKWISQRERKERVY